MKNLLLVLSLFICCTAVAQNIDGIGKQKPITFSGSFGIGLGTYHATGISDRARSLSYMISGNPVISIYGISFPLGIVVSDQQRSFTQPFNQYGVSPQYKWITVHAGWRSITFSPFTLGGAVFLGGGVELNPGKLRFGFISGRFNKAITADSSSAPASFYQQPAYKRTGYAVKLGLGTEANHVDFIYLKARDDSNSVKIPASYNITPAENLVLGVSMRFRFFKHLFFESDVAGSVYTRDLTADTVSNDLLSKAKFITDVVRVNTSTQLLSAGQAALAFQSRDFGLRLQYRRVDPNYQSMGAYYFETDVENYTIAPSFYFLRHRLSINGSIGIQHDNLLQDKAQRSNKNIGNLAIGYNETKFGLNIQYSNYGITQDRGLNPVIDTLRVARTNHNLNGLLRLSLGNESVSHNIILTENFRSLVDLNHSTAAQVESNSKTSNISYQVGLIKSGINVSAIYSYTVLDAATTHTVLNGPSIGFDKQFAKAKISANTYWTYQKQVNNGLNAGDFLNASFSGAYRITKRNGVSATVNYLVSNSQDITIPTFHELRTTLNYTYTF